MVTFMIRSVARNFIDTCTSDVLKEFKCLKDHFDTLKVGLDIAVESQILSK